MPYAGLTGDDPGTYLEQSAMSAPFYDAVTAAQSNTVNLTTPCRGVYIGVAGDLKVMMMSGNDYVFKNLPVGFHPIRAKRIYVLGTAAQEIAVLY